MTDRVVRTSVKDCPTCGGRRYKYHPVEERKLYKGEVVVGKYACTSCGWQSGLEGEVNDNKQTTE